MLYTPEDASSIGGETSDYKPFVTRISPENQMDAEEFRRAGKEIIDFIVDYIENIRSKDVLPNVEQGYLHKILPDSAPEEAESWPQIEEDFHKHIMTGVTNWVSPMFNAYYPTVQCYSSILGEIIAAGIGCQGFNWIASPANTELEVIVLDWLAKMMDLPEHFLATSKGPGGGVIHSSASEGIFVALLAAKNWKANQIHEDKPGLDDGFIKGKLVAYASDQSNSSIEKAGKLGSMVTRLLPCDKLGRMTFEALKSAVEKDIANGFYPCYVVVTLGSTSFCAFDELELIGPYCQQIGIWLHVDAAFAGAGFICPEFRYIKKGIEYADSCNMNPHKWLMINFDCSTFWLKDRKLLIDAFSVESVYLKDVEESTLKHAPEFRHWEISLGRRFRALKLWFTLRSYGVKGIQEHIRSTCKLANVFRDLVAADKRFEIFHPVHMSLVSFRIKGDNELSKKLLQTILTNKKLFMVGTEIHGTYYIRYAVTSHLATVQDTENAWNIISTTADEIISSFNQKVDHSVNFVSSSSGLMKDLNKNKDDSLIKSAESYKKLPM